MFNPYSAQIDQLKESITETQLLLKDPDFAQIAREELITLQKQLTILERSAQEYQLQLETTAAMSAEERVNCTIEIRGGAGGDEAKIWANDVLRMYTRFAETLGFKIEIIDDLVIKFIGKTRKIQLTKDVESPLSAFAVFQHESGVHRVQRVPVTESQGRIHTSTASVAVLPEIPEKEIEIRDEDLEWQFMRSSGAGGQSVNKTSSAVRLIHTPSGITTTARQEKKQEQNRKIALDLLRSQLWEIEEEKRLAELGEHRSSIGRARRSEKIRTYNYPQSRVTDHRTKQSWYDLPAILEGNLEKVMIDLHGELYKQSEKTDE